MLNRIIAAAVLALFVSSPAIAGKFVPNGQCALVVAKFSSADKALQELRRGKSPYARVYKTTKGQYVLSGGNLKQSDKDRAMKSLRKQGLLTASAYCTDGREFAAVIDPKTKTAQSSATAKAFKGSWNKAYKTVMRGNHVKVDVTAGDPTNPSTSTFHTRWFNLAGTKSRADMPMGLHVYLDDSPAARKIKEAGKPVYVYAKPMVGYDRYNFKKGKSEVIAETVRIPDHSNFCDGYYMVLVPSNNYSVTRSFNQRVVFRKKTGRADWEVREAAGVGYAARVEKRAFMVQDRSEEPCYYMPHKKAWK